MCALVLFCLTSSGAIGQIQDLATNDDGSQLYFSSVQLLKGTGEFANAKIFEYVNGEFKLIAEVTPTVALSDGSVFHFDFRMPNVTGDGATLAYDGTSTCSGPIYCPGSFTARGFISGEDLPAEMTNYFGSLRVSRNGRYALRFDGSAAGVPPGAPELYDSQSGQSTLVKPCPAVCIAGDGRQSIADDGTVLTTQGLWRGGEVTGTALNAIVGRLSANAATIVYETVASTYCFGGMFGQCTLSNALHARDIGSGADVQLALGPDYGALGTVGKPYFTPSVSNDGTTVLYRARDPQSGLAQLFLTPANGGLARELTNDPSGIAEGVLSGDGHSAYAANQSGGILAVNVDSGQVTVLLANSPFLTQPVATLTPGSLVTLYTSSATSSEIVIAGLPAPVISSTSNAVSVQVPWEAAVNQSATLEIANPASAFEQALTIQTSSVAPELLATVHGDFRGLVGYNDPASPGEILVLYLTGLGPVAPQVLTGHPAPVAPLSYLQSSLQCLWNPGGQAAQVLFAGLAPLTTGLYQVNLKVPADIITQYGDATLNCTILPTDGSSASTGAVIPMRM